MQWYIYDAVVYLCAVVMVDWHWGEIWYGTTVESAVSISSHHHCSDIRHTPMITEPDLRKNDNRRVDGVLTCCMSAGP